jgi:hypothetical protein
MGTVGIGALQLYFPDVNPTTFYVVVAVGILIILALGLYTAMVFYFGKAMRKYLTAKLRRFSGIIQVYELENVKFHLADLLPGGLFRDLEGLLKKPVVAKSIATLNGVPTVLTWRVTPRLPDVYIKALEKLVTLKFNNVEVIEDKLDVGEIKGSDLLLKKKEIIAKIKGIKSWFAKKEEESYDDYNLTYNEFLALHERVVNRNSVKVTIADILDFSARYLDEHPVSSISEKIANQIQQRHLEGKYMKYAFIIIGITVVMVMAIKVYKVFKAG